MAARQLHAGAPAPSAADRERGAAARARGIVRTSARIAHSLLPSPVPDDDHDLLLALADEAGGTPPRAGRPAEVAATPPRLRPGAAAAAALAAAAAADARVVTPAAGGGPRPHPPYRCALSSLRVVSPPLPRQALAAAVEAAGAAFGKLPLALARLRLAKEGDAPAATVAVVAAGRGARGDGGGRAFATLHLSDLDGGDCTLLAFDGACAAAAALPVGSVVAVVGPRLLPPAKAAPGARAPRPALAVDDATSIIRLGASPDFAICAATASTGARCRAAVDCSVGPVCAAHARREAGRLAAATARQGALADCALASFVRRGAKRSRAPGPPPRADPVVALAAPAAIAAAAATRGGKDTHGVRLAEATAVARAPAAAHATPRGRAAAKADLAWVKAPATGALGARVRREAREGVDMVELDEGSDEGEGGVGAPAPSAPEPPPAPRPVLRPSDPNRVERSSTAARAALAALRGGKVAAPAPAAAALSAFASAFAGVVAANAPPSTSRYGPGAADAAVGGLDDAIEALAEKDARQQRAATLTRLVVRAVTCAACGYTAEAAGRLCVQQGHALTWGKAVKRWWACSGCGARAATVGARHPVNPCAKCRRPASAFVRAAAARERRVEGVECLAERGALLARGEEMPLSIRDA